MNHIRVGSAAAWKHRSVGQGSGGQKTASRVGVDRAQGETSGRATGGEPPLLDKLGKRPVPRAPHVGPPLFIREPTQRPPNWFTKGPRESVEGTRADRAYADFEIPDRLGEHPVIVAVIDSGVDIEHEDLRGAPVMVGGKVTYPNSRIWTNADEVPGNGVDDDGNGYVDDVHGWNFLGSYDAQGNPVNVGSTTLEVTREYLRLKRKQDAGEVLTPAEQAYFAHLDAKVPKDSTSPYYDLNRDRRAEIIGDDQYDFSDRSYGNNDVEGDDAYHGTHVSGLIGAIRNNGLGVDGVAANVKIMPIRAVPDGDEYDKDIANAIRYAADNGAQIINMSFGKGYASGPAGKAAVDAAVAYAREKGVKLFVHAAGNESTNLDESVAHVSNFPNDYVGGDRSREMSGWVEIGASSAARGTGLPAYFSNYGQGSVDFFSPGVGVRSTVPGDGYSSASGTSMAAPVAAGVAALVLSTYPQLTGAQLEEALVRSARDLSDLEVNTPGRWGSTQPFGNLSRTGGVVDAVAALKYASEILARDAEPAS